jgi:hypothetical protein
VGRRLQATDPGWCFCDAEIGLADMDDHIYAAHMEPKAATARNEQAVLD